jgi:hypothetical protein
MRRSLLLSFLLIPGVLAAQQPATQQATAVGAAPTVDVTRLTTALSAERRRAFMVGMQLTPAQDTIFWPIFEKFEGERRVVSERMVRIVQQYAQAYPNVGDDQAWQMVTGTADAEKELVAIRQKASDEVKKKINGRAALRFYILDDYLTTAVRLGVLDDMPVVSTTAP